MLQFINLQSQYKRIQFELEERVIAVLRSGQYIFGQEVYQFKNKYSNILFKLYEPLLLEKGLILPGEILTDLRKRWTAKVRADGSLISNENKGSIHSVGAALQGLPACNGWTFWYIQRAGKLVPIDHLRNSIRLTFQTL